MNANILKWLLVGIFSLSGLATVDNVGKPGKVTSSGVAAVTVLINALLIAAVLRYF